MTTRASWICYYPRAFEAVRDYGILTSESNIRTRAADAFTAHAEEAMRAYARASQVPLWQFADLGPGEPMVLSRCSTAEQSGTYAPVVWGLLLPLEYLRSRKFSLSRCVQLFPGDRFEPAKATELVELPEQQHGKSSDLAFAMGLIGAFVPGQTVQIGVDAAGALPLFCRLVEALPPSNRARATFSTAPISRRAFEANVHAPPIDSLARSPQMNAKLALWSIGSQSDNASILDQVPTWIFRDVDPEHVAEHYVLIAEHLDSKADLTDEERKIAHQLLRQALEQHLAQLTERESARVLQQLPENAVPPKWFARVALGRNHLGFFPRKLRETLLHPDNLPIVLDACRKPPPLARAMTLAAVLETLPKQRSSDLMYDACGQAMAPLHDGKRAKEEFLPQIVTLLELSDHARLGPLKLSELLAR